MTTPILYTFRRCPYAMRARLAIASAGINVELREILLRDKPAQMLAISPKGTVPVILDGTQVIDESLNVMLWALNQNDPDNWLENTAQSCALIARCDGPFKTALDHTKYAVRFPDLDASAERETAAIFLRQLDTLLADNTFLLGPAPPASPIWGSPPSYANSPTLIAPGLTPNLGPT